MLKKYKKLMIISRERTFRPEKLPKKAPEKGTKKRQKKARKTAKLCEKA